MKDNFNRNLIYLPLLAILLLSLPLQARELSTKNPAPPFKQTDSDAWINSEPLDWEQLKGKVVLLNIWTYGCSNCKRSLPWLKSIYSKYQQQGLEIIGVHSPEFAWEKPRLAVNTAVKHHDIEWPVMMDNDMEYWRSLGNRYWPSFYLIDTQGNVTGHFIGETHPGDKQANAMETMIETLVKK
jgi:glutathione peroxidase-family protein